MDKTLYEYMKNVVEYNFVYPCSAEFHPTDECNQDCIWCIMREHRKEEANFSHEQLQKLAGQLIEGKYIRYFFISGGGEPLCNDALFDEYQYGGSLYSSFFELLNKYGISLSISSNGENLRRLVDSGAWKYIERIRVSIDAGREDTYRKLHRSKNRMKLIEIVHGIEYYYKVSGKKVEISFLEMERNKDEYLELADLFIIPEAISKIVIKYLIGDKENKGDLRIDVNGINIVRSSKKNLPLSNYVNRTNILITANGDVYPCCHNIDERKNRLGNLHIEDLNKIIERNQDFITSYNCYRCMNLDMNILLNEFSSIYHRRKNG